MMENKLYLPAGYAVLSDDEMTYTAGGSASGVGSVMFTGAAAVGGVVLASSYVWGIGQARSWLSASSNTKGNLFTVLGKAFDDIGADMSKSAANFVRDGVSTAMVIALAPLSAILLVVK